MRGITDALTTAYVVPKTACPIVHWCKTGQIPVTATLSAVNLWRAVRSLGRQAAQQG
jgi:hypothetical protein